MSDAFLSPVHVLSEKDVFEFFSDMYGEIYENVKKMCYIVKNVLIKIYS